MIEPQKASAYLERQKAFEESIAGSVSRVVDSAESAVQSLLRDCKTAEEFAAALKMVALSGESALILWQSKTPREATDVSG